MSNPTNSRAFPDILRISYLLRNTYNSPPEKQTKRLKQQQSYYGKTMPLTYSHFFGLIGLLRKTITLITSIFRPAPLYVSECDTRGVHKSCGLAAQTFMLSMAEQGYDTCPLKGSIAEE